MKLTIQTKIQNYINEFETKQRDDGTSYTYLKDIKSENGAKLYNALHKFNGSYPSNETCSTCLSCLENIIEYFNWEDDDEIKLEKLRDISSEIVDGMVDIYYSNILKWLSSDLNNVYYITQALEEFGEGEFKDGFRLLSTAQYLYIDEIMQEVINLLED